MFSVVKITSRTSGMIFDFDMTEQMSLRAMIKLGVASRHKSYHEVRDH